MSNTALKGYTTPATSAEAGTWGADLNTNFQGIVDVNMAGLLTLSLSSTNYTLTASDVQKAMIRLTGALLSSIILTPDVSALFNGFYYWENVTTNDFSVYITTGAGTIALPQSRRGVLFVDSANGPRIVGIVGTTSAEPIPVGSSTIWYNTAAPSGWTAVAVNDYGIKIVPTGSGGVTSGSVAYSTLFGRTATDSYTLQIADIPSHTHTTSTGSAVATIGGNNVNNNYALAPSTTGATGGGGGHTHSMDMRVQTAAFTLCTKA